MPQHKSAAKRVRQDQKKRAANRLHRSRMRTMMKQLRSTENKEEANSLLSDVKAYLDRLSAKRIIHPNKAANYKSALEKQVNAL
ncbi:MAG: 30S ribosomal protein S20 [Rhodothermales bacterium]|nr:30S ribosomal protein S20 [Rhodothermales bacterium]MBO6778339.1 30S ribosomal protein S20 [Rhodothermales bacterium]